MRRKLVSILFAAFVFAVACAAQAPAVLSQAADSHTYSIYDSKGNRVALEQLIEAMSEAEVVFVGEMHDDAATHQLEAELLQRAFARFAQGDGKTRRSVVLSLEMFERDTQVVLDEYLTGLISERHFLASSRPWKNYQTDYKPLIEFARTHKVPVVAANAPARYVSRVSQNGPGSLASLSKEAGAWLPPIPVAPASPAYAEKFTAFMRGEGGPANPSQPATGTAIAAATPQAQPSAHATTYLLDAQNLRDASMGHAIVESLRHGKRPLVLHVNGKFHSEENMGVPEHVRRYRKKTRMLIVTAIPGESFDAGKMSKLGDYIVLTRSVPRPN